MIVWFDRSLYRRCHNFHRHNSRLHECLLPRRPRTSWPHHHHPSKQGESRKWQQGHLQHRKTMMLSLRLRTVVEKKLKSSLLSTVLRHRREPWITEETEQQRSHIEGLPAELLLIVNTFLPEGSRIALRLISPSTLQAWCVSWKKEEMNKKIVSRIRFEYVQKATKRKGW